MLSTDLPVKQHLLKTDANTQKKQHTMNENVDKHAGRRYRNQL